MRDYLLDTSDSSPRSMPKCPILVINIEGIIISALTDTASEVSAISKKIYLAHESNLVKCPTLPLIDITVTGATNTKVTEVKKQIFTKIDVG